MQTDTVFRNARYEADGTITCDIDHPSLGWIPFTASPNDPEPHGREIFAHVSTVGPVAPYIDPPPPSPGEMKEAFRQAVEAHVDATARSRMYENGTSLAGYVKSAVPAWAAEAQAFVAWRDQVWLYVFGLLAQVEAGTAPPPASPAALVAALPAIEWPVATNEVDA